MLTLDSVAKAHGAAPLFRDVSLQLVAGQRVALIGANGTGKTTLLEILVGLQTPDQGTVTRARDVRVGYLPQDVVEVGAGTVLDHVLEGAAEVTDLAARLRDLEQRIADCDDADERDGLVRVHGREHDRFLHLGGYGIEAEAHRVLAGLGFAPADGERPIGELSGGWRVRAALARLLLADPEVLVLDEPTNHLDVGTIAWLERALVAFPGALVFVSHDRDFIEAVAERVVELAHGTTHSYVGGFAAFVEQRAQRLAASEAAARTQARQVAATERFIERFRYKATKARQVQSRVKALDRLERVEVIRDRDPKVRFAFPEPRRAGRVVVELRGVTVGFGGEPVLRDADLVLERGMKVGVVGPNGAGKSTLLRVLTGELAAEAGEVVLGHNVDVAHFAQHQVETLRQDRRVIEEFRSGLTDAHRGRNHRTLLGAFGFTGDDADRVVRSLSGGEQTRLALGRLMATSANLLCLDEPTNHLDIPSRGLLEEALGAYPGTVLLVTHDRHVLRTVVDHVLEVRDQRVRLFATDYESYVADRDPGPATGRRAARATAEDAGGPLRDPTDGDGRSGPRGQRSRRERAARRREAEQRNARYRATRELRAAVERVEVQLVAAEADVAELTRALADPRTYTDEARARTLVAGHAAAKDRADALMAQWEAAQLALEEAEAAVP